MTNKHIETRTDLHPYMMEVWKTMERRPNTWFGVPCEKNPMDFWVYQELLYDMKPDVILEIGNNKGGSTYAFAHLLDMMGHGRIITCDITDEWADPKPELRNHPRITWLWGDAGAPEMEHTIRSLIKPEDRVFVIEDSSHMADNTYKLLNMYHDLTRVGDYFVVEDSASEHGLHWPNGPGHGPLGNDPGPYPAIEAFLMEHPNWGADRDMERFVVTWSPKGFLKRNS